MSQTPEFNVFVGWSGSRSKAIATLLRDWLPNITDDFRPWMSSEDIAKGSSWKTEIQKQLGVCRVGIIVLTPENVEAPWVLFEAGAIYKALETTRTCVLLCGLSPPLIGPLGEFQATEFEENDFQRLLKDVAELLAPNQRSAAIEKRFEKFWPDLMKPANAAIESTPKTAGPPRSPESEMFATILSDIRSLGRQQEMILHQLSRLSRPHGPSRWVTMPDQGPFVPLVSADKIQVAPICMPSFSGLSSEEKEQVVSLVRSAVGSLNLPPSTETDELKLRSDRFIVVVNVQTDSQGVPEVEIERIQRIGLHPRDSSSQLPDQ